jgi:hypothetical protein
MTPYSSWFRVPLTAATLLLGVFSLLAACTKPKAPAEPGEHSEQATRAAAPPPSEPLTLEINGFNYTDLYIDGFEVNGEGGGNLNVSSPTSGGGTGVCCTRWWPDTTLPMRLIIRWTRDRKRWCEKEVLLNGPVPARPRHFAVHFFPDGHIEAELTENYPEVKLRLERVDEGRRKESGNTVADERVARCQDSQP